MGRDSILNEAEKKAAQTDSSNDQEDSEEREQMTFRTSKARKKELDNLADDLGMSTNALLNMFAKQGLERFK